MIEWENIDLLTLGAYVSQLNLTRDDARTRAQLINVDSYDITLVLDGHGDTFRTITTVRFSAQDGTDSFIDAITDTVTSVVLNGEELDVSQVVSEGRIALPGLAQRNELTVDATFFYMNTGEGLHRFVDPVDNETYLYSQFEVPDSRRVFPVFEQPDMKATFAFNVIAPKHWEVFSNSPTPRPHDLGEFADLAESQKSAVWQFAPTPPISSYITAIVAGPYTGVRDSLVSSDGETVPLGVFCRASLASHLDADNIIETTKAGFAFFEEHFQTPYPFEKYDQIFVPEFNAGAMENAGCVTFVESYVFRSRATAATVERRDVTILHELAHMWFGDLVTMKWWNDLWLNESFAEFMSTLATAEATRFGDAWTTFATLEKAWAYRQDQLPSTHPIEADIADLHDVEVNFDGITYAKGASVLKQLVAYVGRENFFTGLKAYFDTHAWKNTELRDLLVELEKASGRDLDEWVRVWLQESGVNLLKPELKVSDGVLTELLILQEPWVIEGQPTPSLRPHRLAVGLYSLQDDKLVRTELIHLDVNQAVTYVPLPPDTPQPDLVLVNDTDLTYAKIRFDDASLETALAHLSGIDDSLAQLLVLSTVWDMVRDAELPLERYIELLEANIDAVTHSTGLTVQIRQLTTAVESYTSPQERAELSSRVADFLWEATLRSPENSDQQFQLFKAFVTHATTPEQLDRLEGIHSGDLDAPDGITIDKDLAWGIVSYLALHDRISDQDIDALMNEDNTASGIRFAHVARSARCTTNSKKRAYDLATGDTSLPNAVIVAVTSGFSMGIEQADGTLIDSGDENSFADLFYAHVEDWWNTRTLEIAQTLTLRLHPPASCETASRTREWLETHPNAHKGARRLMRELLDATERSLRVRETSQSHSRDA